MAPSHVAADFCFLCRVKVLILHQHFRTPQRGGAIRSYYLAKALVKRGVHTVVITAHNGPEMKENLEGVDVHYLSVGYDNRFAFNRRIISFYRFMIKAVKAASQHRDANLCYAISTPLTTGWAARRIRQRYGIPYIFEVGDLWPDAPVAMGFIRNGFVKNLLYGMERAIYEEAASIVALSDPIRDAIREKVAGKKVHVISNMADTDFFNIQEKPRALEEKFGVIGKFVVSYIGALGVANGLRYFIDCAAASQRQGLKMHFILCGDGAMKNDLIAYGRKLRLTNFTVIPFQDRAGVRDIMSVTDANFICYQPVRVLETGSPNKYFDGLAAGKLTVVNFGGWVKEEIQSHACGIYVDAKDAEDFVREIRPFVDHGSLLKRYQHAGRHLAERKYSRKELAAFFADLVASQIENTGRMPKALGTQ